jgi:uncharacterized protein YjiS (DUF1127 family)
METLNIEHCRKEAHMTPTVNVAYRPGIYVDVEQTLNSYAGRLRKALADHRRYRRTLAQLRALSMRQIEDIGYAGADLASVARTWVARS